MERQTLLFSFGVPRLSRLSSSSLRIFSMKFERRRCSVAAKDTSFTLKRALGTHLLQGPAKSASVIEQDLEIAARCWAQTAHLAAA